MKKGICDEHCFCKDEFSLLAVLTVIQVALVSVIATGFGIPPASPMTDVVLLAKYYGRVLCKCSESPSGKR